MFILEYLQRILSMLACSRTTLISRMVSACGYVPFALKYELKNNVKNGWIANKALQAVGSVKL